MPGVLTHVLAGLALATVVHLYHFRFEFSMSVFVGSLLPDALKFGLVALKQLTFAIFSVEHDAFFHALARITSDSTNWFTLGFAVLATTVLLYHFHIIKRKKLEEYDELVLFLILGVIAHLMLDAFIIERGPWL